MEICRYIIKNKSVSQAAIVSTAGDGTVIFVKLIIDQGKAPNDN